MADPANKQAIYEDLYNIPENMIGELINGEMFTMPRPSPKHAKAASGIGIEIGNPYQYGRGGPGGWIILFEPELQMDESILVPDLAGWKKERLPKSPDTNYISVTPDWICEVLSPRTAGIDKVKKMPIYAENKVKYLWLLDPMSKTLDVFKLESTHWRLLSSYAEDGKVRAEPFQEIEFSLSGLWW